MRGVDGKVARCPALRRNMLERRQRALLRIDCEYGDAVMAAVRVIEELTVRRDFDFRVRVLTFEILWKRGDRLQGMQDPTSSVIGERGNSGLQFVDHVNKLPIL